MKKILTLSLVLLFAFASLTYAGQTATRAEFEEYLKIMTGRWIGDVAWDVDSPGFGKKGDKVVGYYQGTLIADGKALTGVFYGGTGTSVSVLYYDPGSKQIKILAVDSGGGAATRIAFKRKGQWVESTTAFQADGTKVTSENTLTLSNGGNVGSWSGSTFVNGKKEGETKDVWRRVAK